MKNISIFNYQDKEVRTITDENGNPWFVGKDVALILGYSNTREAIRTHCKKANDFREAGNPTPKKIIPE